MHGQPFSWHRFKAWQDSADLSYADFVSCDVAASIDWMIQSELFAQLHKVMCDKMSQTIPSQQDFQPQPHRVMFSGIHQLVLLDLHKCMPAKALAQ